MKYLLTLFFLMTVSAFAQDAMISGKITGEKNTPLFGANVVIEGTIEGATTDSTGYYEFETSKTGVQNLLFTYLDCNEKRQTVNIEAGKPMELNVQLQKAVVETEEIIVTAS
ncbi:MAG: carboxypeptidase-like regulatory domain-containing protein, partial [Ignavibacteria bacterium]|nr:carboxypeptidase-like regulatory domain-containing protein [Ignavibacteria bacterium]